VEDAVVEPQPTTTDSASSKKRAAGPSVKNIQLRDIIAEPGIERRNPDDDNVDDSEENGSGGLEKRGDSNSCGGSGWQWSQIADATNWLGQVTDYGYDSGMQAFCNAVDGITVPYNKELNAQVDDIRLTKFGGKKGHLIGQSERTLDAITLLIPSF